jgi:hypothetical protein
MQLWADSVLAATMESQPRLLLEGLLALIYEQDSAALSEAIFEKMATAPVGELRDQILLEYMRVVSLALIRDRRGDEKDARKKFKDRIGPQLLARYPSEDWRVNRELQVLMAFMQTPGAIAAILEQLTPEKSQQEQIHTVYALRSIGEGWTQPQRAKLVQWFDHGREIRGAASMEGYINGLWESTLDILPKDERRAAEAHKKKQIALRHAAAQDLMAEIKGKKQKASSDLQQRSFEELSEYLEYDPMAYRTPDLERGRRVFMTSRCADCHVFGSIGRGGGPDLSTVTSRFRRRDILESIMDPSKTISDQYAAVDVKTRDGALTTGMVVEEDETTLTLITVRGERVEIDKADIADRYDSKISIMPDGLLDTMSRGDLVQLMHFLERGSDL